MRMPILVHLGEALFLNAFENKNKNFLKQRNRRIVKLRSFEIQFAEVPKLENYNYLLILVIAAYEIQNISIWVEILR